MFHLKKGKEGVEVEIHFSLSSIQYIFYLIFFFSLFLLIPMGNIVGKSSTAAVVKNIFNKKFPLNYSLYIFISGQGERLYQSQRIEGKFCIHVFIICFVFTFKYFSHNFGSGSDADILVIVANTIPGRIRIHIFLKVFSIFFYKIKISFSNGSLRFRL